MKVYISGKITGLSQEEYERTFEEAELEILQNGDQPVNPVKVENLCVEECGSASTFKDGSYKHTWGCYMKYDIIALLDCDAIYVLDNWMDSKGARIEVALADGAGIPLYQRS